MITAAEQSVAQNPAYRLATLGAPSWCAVFLSALECFLFFFLVATVLHRPRALHQPGRGHPSAGEDLPERPPNQPHHHDEAHEDGEGDEQRDDGMVPNRDRDRRDEGELSDIRDAVRNRLWRC